MSPLPLVPVVAAIIWNGPRFLAAERPPGKVQSGLWEFPGGKVHPGEGLEDALRRELDEELGIVPSTFELWREKRKAYAHIRVHLHFFHVWSYTGCICPREGQTLAWMTAAQAVGKPFLEADREVVADLGVFAQSHGFCM